MLTLLLLALFVIGIVATLEIHHVRGLLQRQLEHSKQIVEAMFLFPPAELERARLAVRTAEAAEQDAGEQRDIAREKGNLTVDEEIQYHRLQSKVAYDLSEARLYLDFLLENNAPVFVGRKDAATVREAHETLSMSGERLFVLHARDRVFELVVRGGQVIMVDDLMPGHVLTFTCGTCSSEQQITVGDLRARRHESTVCQACQRQNDIKRFRLSAAHNPFVEDVFVSDEPHDTVLKPTIGAVTESKS